MIGVYFSGTGNTRHCVERFVQELEPDGETFSIETERVVEAICAHNEIVMGYPVQFSNLPKILRDFVIRLYGKRSGSLLLQQWGYSAETELACWPVYWPDMVQL